MLHVLTFKGHHQVHINKKKGCQISCLIISMKEISVLQLNLLQYNRLQTIAAVYY
jgi:hypothetical protein